MRQTAFQTQTILQAVACGLLFLVYFFFFRSANLSAIDGSIRLFPVLLEGEPFLHGNNHLLYPVHIHYFAELLSALGIALDPPFVAFRALTILNASLAAASLAIFYVLLSSLGITSRWCAFAVLLLGFSQSFMVNATNPNEPMPGFFLSMLAAFSFTQGIQNRRLLMQIAGLLLAGFLLGWAMACYQSMIIIAVPFALIAAWDVLQFRTLRSCVPVLTFSLSVLLGVIFAHGLAYVLFSDVDSVQGVFERLFTLDGRGKAVWGRLSLTNLILLPFAITAAFFEVPFFGLKRTFFPISAQIENTLLWLLPAAAMFALLLSLGFAARQLPRPWPKRIVAALVCLPFLLFVPYWWAVFYPKLWLQPMAVVAAACAGIFTEVETRQARYRRGYYAVALCFVLFLAAWNSMQLAVTNATPRVEHTISEEIDQRVEHDAVIFFGWSAIARHFTNLYPAARDFHDIPLLATDLTQEELIAEMDFIIQDARERAVAVYFLGVVDIPEEAWRLFYGDFLKIEWTALEKYRRNLTELETYRTPKKEVRLYRLR